jgi:hypothetical protein
MPHTCKADNNVSRDAAIIILSKQQGLDNPLLSARAVVEREMMGAFNKSPTRELLVKMNIVRAVQWKKMIQFMKNPKNLHFDWGIFSITISL